MSVESLAVVLHHSRATGTAKLVMVGIANHDGDGGAWPSVATLARYANVDPRTVKRALGALVRAGEVRRHVQAGGTRDTADHERPNRYDVLVACPEGCDRSAQHRPLKGWRRLSSGVFEPVDNRPVEGVTPVSPGDASVTPPGDATVTQTIPSTSDTQGPAYVTTPREGNGECVVCGLTRARCALRQGTDALFAHEFTPLASRRPAARDTDDHEPGSRTTGKNAAARLSDAVEEGERSPAAGGSPAGDPTEKRSLDEEG